MCPAKGGPALRPVVPKWDPKADGDGTQAGATDANKMGGEDTMGEKTGAGSGMALGLGIVLDLPSVWYLAALNEIAKSGYATTVEVALVLAFNVVMFALVEIPLLMFLLNPDRARARVERLNAALRDHARQLAVTVASLVGGYLMLSGLLSIL